MPIQWRPDIQQAAQLAIRVCPFCHEPACFSLYKQSTKFTFMFALPLARVGAKWVVACERCSHTWDVDDSKALGLIAESKWVPNHDTATKIWAEINSCFQQWTDDSQEFAGCEDPFKVLEVAKKRLTGRFNQDHVKQVAQIYISWWGPH